MESWRMTRKKYVVVQGKIDQSSHYDEIKMRSLSKCQFLDSYSNEGSDIAIRFDGISSRLTIPWRDFIHSSQSIMLFGFWFAIFARSVVCCIILENETSACTSHPPTVFI